jgi:serpin B
MRDRSTLALLGFLAFLSACGGSGSGAPTGDGSALSEAKSTVQRDPVVAASSANLQIAVTANNAFALELYSRVRASGAGANVFLSPLSASLALTMTYAGARGTTATQMATALHFDPADGSIFDGQNALSQALAARAPAALAIAQRAANGGAGASAVPSADDYRLDVVNSVWGQKTYPWEGSFLDVLARSYGTGVYLEDFVTSSEPARQAINAWVSTQTADKINDLIPAGAIDATTRLVLVDAIHLKLPWALPFQPAQTSPGPFARSDGTSVTATFMNETTDLPYVDDGQAQLVALPLAGNELEVVFALPHGDLATYEAGLTTGSALALMPQAESTSVSIQVPKLTYTSAPFSLAAPLKAMGMTQAFDATAADFSGMCADPPDGETLYVSDVVQKATLGLQETGVEAAAATAVFVDASLSIATPTSIHLNRPFVMAIVDTTTHAILFLGHIGDPTDAGSP